MVVCLQPFSSFVPRRYSIANFWTTKEVFLPFLFKYLLFSHFSDEIESLFSHYPIVIWWKCIGFFSFQGENIIASKLGIKVHYIAQMFGVLKQIIYFCTKSVIYCTMKYGELIKERRTVLGLTQQDLSDYTELSLRIIKSVESEKSNPSLKTLEKIAEVLGLELIMRVKIINE